MITVNQIRNVLQRVVLSELSLDDFDEWLTKASWNMHKDSAPEAVRAVGEIELRLAEYDSGKDAESQHEFVQELLALLPSIETGNVPISATSAVIATSSHVSR